MMKPLIFTDLDETLLERRTYSFDRALEALVFIKKKDIPLVIVSSKTRAEIEHYREKLHNIHPFVVENGGGIYIPHGYFRDLSNITISRQEAYDVIVLGTPYAELRQALQLLRTEGFIVRGFGDMTQEEIIHLTGLSTEDAKMAAERQFDEPFTFEGDIRKLSVSVERKDLRLSMGRFFHLTGESDKGRAVDILLELYRRQFGDITSIALGDSPSDAPMLRMVDCPVLVQKDDGTYDENVKVPKLIKAEGIGPEGWKRAVMKLLC
jgi:mannosyl-3-phosphoglycerate phosphatase